jgi:hypothetical protein
MGRYVEMMKLFAQVSKSKCRKAPDLDKIQFLTDLSQIKGAIPKPRRGEPMVTLYTIPPELLEGLSIEREE